MQLALFIGLLATFGMGLLVQWSAWRFRIPAIVLLFAAGLILGPGLHILHPSAALGPVFHPLVALMVALVVFEGALALDFHQLKEAGEGVARLILLALPINFFLGAGAAHWVGQFDWSVAALFGAITVVTGPTVVMPLLRQTRLQPRVAAFLRWEAIINDSLGAILASIVLQLILLRLDLHRTLFFTYALPDLVIAGAQSVAIGLLPAYGIRYFFNHDLMPEFLKMPALVTVALLIYQLCTLQIEGAGLIGVTVFGMALANLRITGLNDLRRVKESLGVLIVSVLFLLLTADLHRSVLARLSLPLLLLTLALMFAVRPAAIFLSTIKSGLSWQERLFVGWIAPRGIVAAAVAGTAGMRVLSVGDPDGALIVPAVFTVIALTMICHGFTFRPLAQLLHLAFGGEAGLAIVGAVPWTDNLGLAIKQSGGGVLMVDSRMSDLKRSMAKGLPVLKADLLSYLGQTNLEEQPVDYLLAATDDPLFNAMICSQLAPEMGRQRVFQISPGIKKLDYQYGISRDARGRVFGSSRCNSGFIESQYDKGWRFVPYQLPQGKTLTLPDSTHPWCVAVVRKNGAVWIASDENPASIAVSQDDAIISFLSPETQKELRETCARQTQAQREEDEGAAGEIA